MVESAPQKNLNPQNTRQSNKQIVCVFVRVWEVVRERYSCSDLVSDTSFRLVAIYRTTVVKTPASITCRYPSPGPGSGPSLSF